MSWAITARRKVGLGAMLLASLLLCGVSAAGAQSAGLNSRTAIERAVLYIDLGDYQLARSYLTRPLIDPRITTTERSRAYYLQGYSFELSGLYTSAAQNYARALAFNPDNPATLAALGHLYSKGLGIPQDREQADDLLRRSAQLGHAPGMTQLGASLLLGLRDSQTPVDDLGEARTWLIKAANVNDAKALLFLAQSYRTPHTQSPAPEKALAFYRQALVLNEAAAFNSIGNMYLRGELGSIDADAAVEAFRRGAQANDGPALVSLGYLYLIGKHVSDEEPNRPNQEEAKRLFSQAAETGESRAHHYLGYLAETEAPTDAKEQIDNEALAIEHYRAAAAQSYPPALKRLSELAFANDRAAAGISYLKDYLSTIAADSAPVSRRREAYWHGQHQLAWLLATHTEAGLRDGREALTIAKALVNHTRSAATLDTLAAAYAETENFPSAINTQTQAIEMLDNPEPSDRAPDSNTLLGANVARRTDYAQRLLAYEQQTPWRQNPAQEEDAETAATVAPK